MENLKRLYHVADPEFWTFWRKNGPFTGVELTPRIGEQCLNLRFRKAPIHFTLAGGTVTGVELIALKPRAIVRVKLTNAPRSIKLTLLNGPEIQYKGRQDAIQLQITKHREADYSFGAFCNYYWASPHYIGFFITGTRHGVEFWMQGWMPLARLETIIRSGELLKLKGEGDQAKQVIALPVANLDESGGPAKRHGTLFFPPEVSVQHLLKTLAVLTPFANFARQFGPSLKKQRPAA